MRFVPALTAAGRLVRAVLALVVLVGLLAGVPWALWHFVGWPGPHTVPTLTRLGAELSRPLDIEVLVKALACLVWLGWVQLVVCVVAETGAVLARASAPRVPAAGPAQAVAASLLGAVVLPLLAGAGRPSVPTPDLSAEPVAARAHGDPQHRSLQVIGGPPAAPAGPVASSKPASSDPPDPPHSRAVAGRPGPAGSAGGQPAPPRVHRVVRGDSLWRIAAQQLGDPTLWPQIYHLNAGRPQPDGRRLTNPNLIQPGWILALPINAAATPATPPAAPALPPSPPAPAPPNGSAVGPQRSGVAGPPQQQGRSVQPVAGDGLSLTIRLPTGAVVGMSLAATIAAAAIMTRQHQQRRRIPGDPTQPQPAPQLPATAAYLERLHNEFSAHRAQDGSSPAHGGVVSSAPGSPHEQREPARLVVGVDPNGDNEVDLNLPAICMLTLSGPAAADVARYLAIGLVGNDKPRCLYQHLIEIVIPEHDLEALVGPPGNDLILPRCIHVVTDLPAALSRLEAELVYRTRLLDERGLSNTHQLRTAALDGTDDGEWIGTLTLLAQPGPEFATRLETILRAGQHLDVTAILISDRPVTQLGQTWSVDSEGRVADTSPPASAVPLGTQLYRFDKKAARDVISTLAAAHGEPPPNRPVEPTPSSNPTHMPSTPPATQSQQTPAAADEESLAKAGIKGHGQAAHQSATPSEPPAAITVLGQPHIDVHGQHVSTGLRSHALELAVLLVLHPEGITRDRILDTIWSTEPLSSAQQGFAAARANLRHVLRDSTKLHEHEFVVRRGKTYSLDARLIKADLREIEEQLSQVAEAGTEKERLDALLALAAREYRPIADGSQYPWIAPYRQALADQLADAHIELASRLEADRPREAAAAYQRALTCNRLNEETYRRLMRLQAELGDRDALSRTWRECQRRLALIDVDPDEETKRTADYLLKRLT